MNKKDLTAMPTSTPAPYPVTHTRTTLDPIPVDTTDTARPTRIEPVQNLHELQGYIAF